MAYKKGPGANRGPEPGMNPGITISERNHTMPTLTEKANELKRALPPERSGKPPEMKGIRLGELPHRDGKIIISWDEYEGHHFLSIRLWTVDDNGQLWPSKNGFTVKLRDIAVLGEAIGRAIDLALDESKKPRLLDGTDKF